MCFKILIYKKKIYIFNHDFAFLFLLITCKKNPVKPYKCDNFTTQQNGIFGETLQKVEKHVLLHVVVDF